MEKSGCSLLSLQLSAVVANTGSSCSWQCMDAAYLSALLARARTSSWSSSVSCRQTAGGRHRNSMANRQEPLLAGVDELEHLKEKLRGVMVPKGLCREELLGLLEGGQLVGHQESDLEFVVAAVAGSGEDVGHPAG